MNVILLRCAFPQEVVDVFVLLTGLGYFNSSNLPALFIFFQLHFGIRRFVQLQGEEKEDHA